MSLLQLASEAAASASRIWQTIKIDIESGPVGGQALHVLAGVSLQLAFAAFLRKSVAGWLPWLGVLVLELVNEWSDIAFSTGPGVEGPSYADSAIDVALTMVVPTMLMLVARWRPRVFSR